MNTLILIVHSNTLIYNVYIMYYGLFEGYEISHTWGMDFFYDTDKAMTFNIPPAMFN